MSAAYSEADRILTSAQHHAGEAAPATYGQALALVGLGRAILALVDEVEQIGELLRERLPAPAAPLPMPAPIDEILKLTGGPRCAQCGVRELPHRRLEQLEDEPGIDHRFVLEGPQPQDTRCCICGIRRDAHRRLEANPDGVTTDHEWTPR